MDEPETPGRADQLGLALPFRPAFEADAFLVAAPNQAAVDWIDRWPLWPAPGLVLVGPAGCGKTHLAQVWRARSGAAVIAGAALTALHLPACLQQPAWVVEAAEAAPPRLLLHLYNGLAEAGGFLLLTATAPPARWGIDLADLESRLRALPLATIGPPDDTLFRAVLVKDFADRQIRVGPRLIEYLARRLERSFAAAHDAVARLDAAALAAGRPITVRFAATVLDQASSAGR